MSPTSYQTALSRVVMSLAYPVSGFDLPLLRFRLIQYTSISVDYATLLPN